MGYVLPVKIIEACTELLENVISFIETEPKVRYPIEGQFVPEAIENSKVELSKEEKAGIARNILSWLVFKQRIDLNSPVRKYSWFDKDPRKTISVSVYRTRQSGSLGVFLREYTYPDGSKDYAITGKVMADESDPLA